jgi:hypothetical protein
VANAGSVCTIPRKRRPGSPRRTAQHELSCRGENTSPAAPYRPIRPGVRAKSWCPVHRAGSDDSPVRSASPHRPGRGDEWGGSGVRHCGSSTILAAVLGSFRRTRPALVYHLFVCLSTLPCFVAFALPCRAPLCQSYHIYMHHEPALHAPAEPPVHATQPTAVSWLEATQGEVRDPTPTGS